MIGLGVPPDEAREVTEDARRRDAERLELQVAGGTYAGRELLRGNISVPTPLAPPKRAGKITDAETSRTIDENALPEPGRDGAVWDGDHTEPKR